MHKGRLEAFSDGVIAIIITIMVLEFKMPATAELSALMPMCSTFLAYILSFIFVGIYWNNHHHTFQAVQHVNGAILWANMHLLFWLSLIPFTTAWMGHHSSEAGPVFTYGINLLMAAVAYTILARALVTHHGHNSLLAKAFGDDLKGRISLAIYLIALPAAFFSTIISIGCFITVALIWLVPDRRFERILNKK